MTLPDDAFDAQDKTQLTAGGSPVAGEFSTGDIVGGSYEVVSFIGAGGMGNVYCVRHTIMHTQYALKTLSAEKVTEVAWRRFQNEAQAIARMSHPNIVAIYNLGFHDGRLPFYVMDILQGKSLLDVLKEKGRLETNEALKMFIEVCAGIGYAHKKGIVHRDIKPANIVILDKPDPGGATIKIVDFGIAKLSHTKELANQQLTSMGEVCGSPLYMSPEQCEAGKIDARSDGYSLGCTLFEALTGSPPFKGRNAMETMLLHCSAPPPTLQSACPGGEFPTLLEAAMAKMLAKAPMDRYQNMERLAQDLAAILQGANTLVQVPPAHASRFKPFLLLAAAMAILLIAGASICGINTTTRQNPKQKEEKITEPPIITDTKPFSKLIAKADGKRYVRFSFPMNEDIGQLWLVPHGKRRICQGDDIELPAGTIAFAPGNAFVDHPQYFERFGSNDISELVLEAGDLSKKLPSAALKHLPHLKGLKSLIFNGMFFLDDDALGYVEQLPNLISFTCDDSRISIGALSHSPLLGRLDTLRVSYKEGLSPLLRALQGSPGLHALIMPGAHLTEADFKVIGTMTQLENLTCNGSDLHDKDLLALAPLHHLYKLDLPGNHLTAAAIPVLKAMFKDHKANLDIRSDNIKRDDSQRIEKALPAVVFDHSGPDFFSDIAKDIKAHPPPFDSEIK